MTSVQQFVVIGLQVVVIVGLAHRSLAARACLLTLCLVTNTFAQALQFIHATAFHRWDVWTIKELVLILLAALAVAEVTARVFACLPSAGLRAWGALTLIAVTTGLMVWTAPGVGTGPSSPWLYLTVTQVLPRVALGAGLLCMATIAVMTWYEVPPDRFYRAILFGLAVYLLSYAGPMATSATSEASRFVMYYVTPSVYAAVMAVWAWVVWSREEELSIPRTIAQRVQPWR